MFSTDKADKTSLPLLLELVSPLTKIRFQVATLEASSLGSRLKGGKAMIIIITIITRLKEGKAMGEKLMRLLEEVDAIMVNPNLLELKERRRAIVR